MDEAAKDKKFTVYEWTIENFSSWKIGILKSHLPTEPRLKMVQFTLIRKMASQTLWGAIDKVPRNAKGDFSILYADKSLIWTRRVNENENDGYFIFSHLPFNFCDLVALIRKNEAVQGDQIILRLRIENEEENVFHSMRSMIEVKTMSVKISLSAILNGQPEPSALRRVFTAEYPLSNGSAEKIKVIINESPSSKIELMLISDFPQETIFFGTCMSVFHNDGSLIRTEEREKEISQGEIWTFSDSLTRNEVMLEGLSVFLQLKVFPRDYLKHLYILSSPFATEVTPNSASLKKPDHWHLFEHAVDVLLKDFLSLHQNKDFCDLQLHCDGVSFPVHKSILSARSPVFKSMLSSGMKEAESGCVDIVDLDAPTLARFLTFLYSGSVNDLQSEGALKLYYAADKYQVPTLKTACVTFLSDNLSSKNVCDVLSLADKHQDDRLLSAAHSFILKNYNKVLRSEEWENLMKSDSFLVSKTLTNFARERYVISAEAAKN